MTNSTKLGPWVRRLVEYLVGERNLARNTQRRTATLLPNGSLHRRESPQTD